MRLIDVVAHLNSFDPEMTIYAERPWRHDSNALLAREPEEGGLPQEAQAHGMDYFIEFFIAKDFLDGWTSNESTKRSDIDKCNRLIDYAIRDA